MYLIRQKYRTEKPTITGECFVHEFQWEVVESGEHDFRGLKITITNKKELRLCVWNSSGYGLEVDNVELFESSGNKLPIQKVEPPNYENSSACSLFGFPRFCAGRSFPSKTLLNFKIVLKELHENYPFCLVDRLHGEQLWSAATNRQLTDVEFVVGGRSFHAHRAIVAARSPHFAKMFGTDEKLAKYEIADCDPSTFEQLLFFVYTGGLQASADNKDLLQLAQENEIATLQSVCERALKTSFLSLTRGNLLCMAILFN